MPKDTIALLAKHAVREVFEGTRGIKRPHHMSLAKDAGEVCLQVITLLAKRKFGVIGPTLNHYIHKGLLGEENLVAILRLITNCNPDLGAKLFATITNKEGVHFFQEKHLPGYFEKSVGGNRENAWQDVTPETKWYIFEDFEHEKRSVSTFLLRKWVWEEFTADYPRNRDGKWVAKLAIELYHRGDTTVINPERIVRYLEKLSRLQPESHGIHRLVSLLGFGATHKERGWDLTPHVKDIAEILINVYLGETKREFSASGTRKELPYMFRVLIEILFSYEDKDLSRYVLQELEVKFGNVRRNIGEPVELLRDFYAKSSNG